MKIHYFSADSQEEAYVRTKLAGHEIVFHPEPIGAYPDLADESAEVLCGFISSKIGEAELSRFPALKLIAARSTGFDHIDLSTAKARGIAVANVPFYGENTVAEFAFALILSLSRRIPEAHAKVTSGSFSPDGLRGFDLAGKTLGVVGCGHIGQHAIRMGNGFGMKVIGFDVHQDAELAAKMSFSYASLSELFAASDIVTLHVPYNEHTHHLINSENIGQFKKGAHLINTSRGAVVETDAIVQGLKSGVLGGAGLDVLEEEGELADETAFLSENPNAERMKTAIENHYLINHPRVIITPHLAFNTEEGVTRILDTTIENISKFATGTPTNIVSQ